MNEEILMGELKCWFVKEAVEVHTGPNLFS